MAEVLSRQRLFTTALAVTTNHSLFQTLLPWDVSFKYNLPQHPIPSMY